MRYSLLKKNSKGLNQRNLRLLISAIAGAVGLMNVNRYLPQEKVWKYRVRKYGFLLLAPEAMVNITSRELRIDQARHRVQTF